MGQSPYWVNVAADLLKQEGISHDICLGTGWGELIRWLWKSPGKRYPLVYHIGGTCNKPIDLILPFITRPLIWHWIGTDVVSYSHGKASRGWRQTLNNYVIRKKVKVHLSDSPELAQELSALGISSAVVRLLPALIAGEIKPLPAKFTVLSYWPNERKDFYRGDMVLRLARDFPQADFKILKAQKTDEKLPDNVKYLGTRENMEEIYAHSSLLIRLPRHDSLSAMVLEMLARGRYVIYNKEFPGCHFAQGYEDAKMALEKIMKFTEPNLEAARFVQDHFSVAQEAKKLADYCRRLGEK